MGIKELRSEFLFLPSNVVCVRGKQVLVFSAGGRHLTVQQHHSGTRSRVAPLSPLDQFLPTFLLIYLDKFRVRI